MPIDPRQMAYNIINQMHAMIAYWDTFEKCLFANDAYKKWFGKSQEEMTATSLQELLGPALYSLNRPYLQRVMLGEKQIFERTLHHTSGASQRFLATYVPDATGGTVRGFSVYLTELPTSSDPQQWLPVCANCQDIQSASGKWYSIEACLFKYLQVNITHGLCPKCLPQYFPDCFER